MNSQTTDARLLDEIQPIFPDRVEWRGPVERPLFGSWLYGTFTLLCWYYVYWFFTSLDGNTGLCWLLIAGLVLCWWRRWTFVAGIVPMLVMLIVGIRRDVVWNRLDVGSAFLPGVACLLVIALSARLIAARSGMFDGQWLISSLLSRPPNTSIERRVSISEFSSLLVLVVGWLGARWVLRGLDSGEVVARETFSLLPQTLLAAKLMLGGIVLVQVVHGLLSYVRIAWMRPELARWQLVEAWWSWNGTEQRLLARSEFWDGGWDGGPERSLERRDQSESNSGT